MSLILVLILFQGEPAELLPLNKVLELNGTVQVDELIESMIEDYPLVFTVESVTRELSILGWASERYDIEVGEVLKGTLNMETVFVYVFPVGLHSRDFSALTPGSGVVVSAYRDSEGTAMEGFSTMEDDWVIATVYVVNSEDP